MPTFETLANGDIRVDFPENGTSYVIAGAAALGVSPSNANWHEYTAVTTIHPGTMDANYFYYNENITLADVQLAVLQQTAPEWQSVLGYEQYDPNTPQVVNGDMTETPLPGYVYHLVSDDGLIVLNVTATDEAGDHPFYPGYVIRTVVENADGSFSIISYGIGNATGDYGAVTAALNQLMGHQLFDNDYNLVNQAAVNAIYRLGDQCFLAGTQISMWDGSKKPIEQIAAGDIVVSYDKGGKLVPGRVKRTMTNTATQILDVHGLMVTPGHATLCGDGRFAGQHVPILDILRSDGALVLEDGTKIRAATGCRLGTEEDRMIAAITGERQPNGMVHVAEAGHIRAGTRFILADGKDVSVLDMIRLSGGSLTEDGMIKTSVTGPGMPFCWTFSPNLPKPEDYVLQRSGTHLQDIYQANEWDSVRPSMPSPAGYGRSIAKRVILQ